MKRKILTAAVVSLMMVACGGNESGTTSGGSEVLVMKNKEFNADFFIIKSRYEGKTLELTGYMSDVEETDAASAPNKYLMFITDKEDDKVFMGVTCYSDDKNVLELKGKKVKVTGNPDPKKMGIKDSKVEVVK